MASPQIFVFFDSKKSFLNKTLDDKNNLEKLRLCNFFEDHLWSTDLANFDRK
jgi:hypothetical protein